MAQGCCLGPNANAQTDLAASCGFYKPDQNNALTALDRGSACKLTRDATRGLEN
jgi:hypothetical protein